MGTPCTEKADIYSCAPRGPSALDPSGSLCVHGTQRFVAPAYARLRLLAHWFGRWLLLLCAPL